MAEAEFDSDEEASSLVIPSFVQEEVTDDSRFTGGSLVAATRNELRKWLADYRMTLVYKRLRISCIARTEIPNN